MSNRAFWVGIVIWLCFLLGVPILIAIGASSDAGRQEVTLTSKETGGTLRAFCESGNRVYIHTRGEDTDMVVMAGGCK